MIKMLKRYRIFLLLSLFLFIGSKSSLAQCPQFFDSQGVPSATPQWVSCSGGAFVLFIQPDINVGNYTIDWGDGTPNDNGASIIPPASVSHNYAATVSNYTVTITMPGVPCVVVGQVIMEEPSNASIQIPFGGLTTTCAPGSLDFTNSSTDVSTNTVFTWDFGDGSPIQTFNSTNLGQTVSHMFLQGTVNCVTQVTLTAENVCNTLQGGQSVATFNPIRIFDIDNAAITASATLLCYPDTIVDLTNTTNRNCLAQGNIAQRYEYWNLGDYWGQGTDSIVDWTPWPPTFPQTLAYPGIGTYTAMLVDSSFCGLDTAFITIQIVPPPTAALTISKDTICEGETVTFNNLSAGGANSYMWNFGDGTGWNNLGAGSVNYTYNFAGDYTIQIAAFINGGTASCTDTAIIPVTVLPSPVANFNFDNNNGCDTLTVNFTDFSSADVVTWNWTFGNGNTSTLQNPPSQFYNSPNSYNVQLDVSSNNGCVNSITQVIDVFQSPVPAFSPTSVCMNDLAAFTDLSTSSAGDPIITWGWDFGDGNSSTNQNPTHVYTVAGPVNVILDVSTAFCSASDTVVVTVETVPIAGFTPDITSGCSPLGVNFTNTSSVNATSYFWDFGDGNTSTATNPVYTFINNFGFDTTFNVMLIAQTTFGCVDTIFQPITVFPNPSASFTDNAILDCAPLIVNFTNTSTGGVSYSWDFGDGTPIDNSVNPTHVYQNLTQFIDNNTVTLIVTSLNGCTDTIIDSVLVFPEPQFGFSTNPDSGCSPLIVVFPSVIGAVLYQWDFGDGNTGVGPTPNHIYTNSTTNNVTYIIELIATSPFGCVDTTYGQVLVFPNPTAQFTVDSSSGCHPLPINFTNTSTGGSLFHWDMGDGTTFDTLVSNFGHTFNNITGVQQTYQVSLIAETTKGCKDTVFQNIDVYPDVTALFTSDTIGCSPLDVNFIDASVGALNYTWDFGDGSAISNLANPIHQYTNTTPIDVVYTASLIIESIFGCFDTTQQNITVYATPVASFTPTPFTQIFPNTVISITNTSSPGVWQYTWDFGDSTFSTQQAPSNHVYGTWGTYPITLIVSNANCSDTATQIIDIVPPIPVADFEGPAQGCRPLDVQFVNNSLYGTNYFWDFGDGGISTQFAPSYTYFNPGVYTVKLTVTGPGGQDIQTRSLIIEVYQIPNAFFTVTPTTVFIPNEPALFFNLSSFASTYFWDFGDGSTSIEESPEHFYTQQGVYDIMLIATTQNNCLDTFMLPAGVEAKSEGGIKIPNAFTPSTSGSNGGLFSNSDIDNDVFHPIITGAEEYELNIFNKWGELLFISKDVNVGWDGYYRGELSKQDVYVYKIKVKFIDGKSDSYVGDVTLLR
jgi:gliding motility-associated-like protein